MMPADTTKPASQDNELDAILDQLCALQTQFDIELCRVNDDSGSAKSGHLSDDSGPAKNGHLSDDSGSGSLNLAIPDTASSSTVSHRFSRHDSIRSSSTSSSSGWMSERGSNVSTPTMEQLAFPISTIKRKPSSVPKIPLTSTTRNLALHSDDALVDVDSSSSDEESTMGNGNLTRNRGTLRNGTLRRSSTDERLKSRLNYNNNEPVHHHRLQSLSNDNNNKKSVDSINGCLSGSPATPEEAGSNEADDLPLPPPPLVLATSLSTLSLNLPLPPPPELIQVQQSESSQSSSLSSSSSTPSFVSPNNSNAHNPTSPKSPTSLKSPLSPQSPQVPPKPKLFRRLSENGHDKNGVFGKDIRVGAGTFQKGSNDFRKKLVLDPIVSCYGTAARSKNGPTLNGQTKTDSTVDHNKNGLPMTLTSTMTDGAGPQLNDDVAFHNRINSYNLQSHREFNSSLVNYHQGMIYQNHEQMHRQQVPSRTPVNQINQFDQFNQHNQVSEYAKSHTHNHLSQYDGISQPNLNQRQLQLQLRPQQQAQQHQCCQVQYQNGHKQPSQVQYHLQEENDHQGQALNRKLSQQQLQFCQQPQSSQFYHCQQQITPSPQQMNFPLHHYQQNHFAYQQQTCSSKRQDNSQSKLKCPQKNWSNVNSPIIKNPLPAPPETFLREIQRVMDKKWKVAQALSSDVNATPSEILGFRDPVYLPPNNFQVSNYSNSQLQNKNGTYNSGNNNCHYNEVVPKVKSVRISPLIQEIANGHAEVKTSNSRLANKRTPPPPPKRSEKTHLTFRIN